MKRKTNYTKLFGLLALTIFNFHFSTSQAQEKKSMKNLVDMYGMKVMELKLANQMENMLQDKIFCMLECK